MKCYIAATANPWQPYDNNKNKQPTVPEPATYGLMMGGTILLAVFLKKFFRGQR